MLRAFVFFLALGVTVALYGPKSDVIQAGADNFKQEVMKHDGIVIVEFYAPWCGHCKNLTPEYEKAASILKGVVKVVAVDATQHESLAQKYQIQGFPTLKVFGADKRNPVDYQGQRTADGIVTDMMKATSSLIKQRKSGGASGNGGSKSSKSSTKSKGSSKSDVVTLTEANFNALVMESDDLWLVEFYAPWCGHCKKLAPEWESAATQLKANGVKLGAVDATSEQALAQKYGVKGYPTIKAFAAGPKSKGKTYNGPREAAGIVDYAVDLLESSGAPVVVQQITDTGVFDTACGGKTAKLCAVLFLPHILDTGASGRNSYLDLFGEVANNFRKMPFAFAWSEANAQSELEEALSVNGNFPTVAVLNLEKKVYAVLRVSWNKKNVESFMQGVLSGAEKTQSISSVPAIASVSPWDGKDGEIVAEEMSLEELFGDD